MNYQYGITQHVIYAFIALALTACDSGTPPPTPESAAIVQTPIPILAPPTPGTTRTTNKPPRKFHSRNRHHPGKPIPRRLATLAS